MWNAGEGDKQILVLFPYPPAPCPCPRPRPCPLTHRHWMKMLMFEIAVGPPIAENLRTYRTPSTDRRLAEDPATTLRYGSIVHDRKHRKMSSKWKNEQSFLEWLAAKESKHSIELIVSNIAHSDSLLWWERRILRCLCKYTGGRLDWTSGTPAPEEWNRKILSKKTGCRCRLMLKFYRHTEVILGNYESKHDHLLGDENLRFTQLTDRTKDLAMVMVSMGIDAKMIVTLIFPPLSTKLMCAAPAEAHMRVYQVDQSQSWYYDAQHQLHPMDRWGWKNPARWKWRRVHQGLGHLAPTSGYLSDLERQDRPPPPRSGLSPDTFIFCIQTAFQKKQFNIIGKDFVGIDATHNTTQYVGLQLFTLGPWCA